ncbi:hypothetical protein D3C73_1042490 [compost metagenome]
MLNGSLSRWPCSSPTLRLSAHSCKDIEDGSRVKKAFSRNDVDQLDAGRRAVLHTDGQCGGTGAFFSAA